MSTPQGPRKRLPVNPSAEHLRKQAKRRARRDALPLANAQHTLAREYGCRNWPELTHVVETMARGSDQLANVTRKVEPLPTAVRNRDPDEVRRILAAGDYTVHDLDAGLAHAAWYGGDDPDVLKLRRRIFDLLLEHGADPDGQYGSNYGPIVFGCGECLDPNGLRWLIDAGADVTFPPVETKYGRLCLLDHVLGTYARGRNQQKHEMIEMVLAAGAYVPAAVTPPILAIHRGGAGVLGALLDADPSLVHRTFADMPYGNIDLRGASLLHCAIEFGEIECCDELLRRGADINIRAQIIDGIGGQTPVFHAIGSNQGGIVYMLEHLVGRVGRSIDMAVKATFRLYGEPHTEPVTPLEYAEECASGRVPEWRRIGHRELQLVRELDRDQALSLAIRGRDLLTARAMLDAGADPNRRGARGDTPLHLAAQYGPVKMVELLQSHGGLAWITDENGRKAEDHARESTDLREDQKSRIIELLTQPRIDDPVFRCAVDAIDRGEVSALQRLLQENAGLSRARAESDTGSFAGQYFARPALLWFVAENPTRNGTLPPGICEIAEVIIDAGVDQRDLDETLGLVMTSRVAREQGLQAKLMETLIRRGAESTPEMISGALAHGERDAVQVLLERGLPMTSRIAAGLGHIADLERLLLSADEEERQAALSLAVINREVDAARLCLEAGANPNRHAAVHSHSMPIHQAAVNDDVAMLQLLVEHGARLDVRDTMWNGTPLGWAVHTRKPAAEAFLRSIGAP